MRANAGDAVKIAHLSSVHPRSDSRVFLKQCRGLAARGHEVTLVVADGKGDERKDGVSIVDVGREPGRVRRALRSTRAVLRKALSLDAELYQLHDPELLPAGLRLQRAGKAVLYDAHEDVPKQILAKPYLGPRRLRLLSKAYATYERYACRRLDGIVAATPAIGRKFRPINGRTAVVNNYPIPDELYTAAPFDERRASVCYVGGLSEARGLREIVAAIERVEAPVRLQLAGTFHDSDLEASLQAMPGWARTDALGFVDRHGVRQVLAQSIAGLVTLHPTPNHLESHPIKMFEYMAAGIPVIASDFPLWRRIVEESDCGYCVDPLDPGAIAAAIARLAGNRDEARRLGSNGRAAVIDRYNWPTEEGSLVDLYVSVQGDNGDR